MIFKAKRWAVGPLLVFLVATQPASVFAAATADEVSVDVSPAQQAQLTIAKWGDEVAGLEQREQGSEGIRRDVLQRRLANARMALFLSGLDYIEALQTERQEGADIAAHSARVVSILELHPQLAAAITDGIRSRIAIPAPGLSAAEEAAAYVRVFDAINELDALYAAFLKSINLAREYQLDVSDEVVQLKANLADRAANNAVLLDLAMDEARGVQAAVAVLPDAPELKARLALIDSRIASLAEALNNILPLMEELAMNTDVYREQAISASGQISTEVLDSGVLARLLIGWSDQVQAFLLEDGPDLALKLLLFLFIIFVAKKLSQVSGALIDAAMERSAGHLSVLLRRMVVSVAANIIFILGILVALSQIGISLGPLLAGLGVAGFVIGFAMQDVLSNFASGMMILVYRPFDVGDLVDTGGVFGEVSHMSLVNTTILTLDNQTIVIPNNKIWGDVIKNVTQQKIRRVDMVFGIGYGDDIPKVESLLASIVESEELILNEPKPIIQVHELGDSSVNFIVRPWVNTADYWDAYWAITRAVKMRFDEEGVSIPFPQRDFHLDTSQPLSVRIDTDA